MSVERYAWGQLVSPRSASPLTPLVQEGPAVDRAALERDAFLKGYAQGEKTGAEVGAKRAEAMLRRLGETVEELTRLRSEILHRTEQHVVQLAIAIAKRIVHREVAADRTLLIGMARAALDRFDEQPIATVRLHPDDYAAVSSGGPAEDSRLTLLADPIVARGSCLVESDLGFMDVSPDAQLEELVGAMFDDTSRGPAMLTEGSGTNVRP